jgi:phage repressor protein C with HTH and peptisase S24 domain
MAISMTHIEMLQALLGEMTQAELAERLETSQPTISRWLAGSSPQGTRLDKIRVLAAEYGYGVKSDVDIAELTTNYPLVHEYDVNVSAGDGAIVENENVKSNWPFNIEYLHNELRVSPGQLALVEVRGDSMEPTLSSGDRVMIDTKDCNVSQPGIFVLWDGDGTVVKRLERVYDAAKPTIALISDNTRHSRYEVHVDRVKVVGRVIWCAKRL